MREEKPHKSKKFKILSIIISCVIISFFVVIMPIMSISVYDDNFGERYETESWTTYSVSDFDGL